MSIYNHYFFDLYGTLVDIRTDEQKPALWHGMAEFYALCGAGYTPGELKNRYFSLCMEETEKLAASYPLHKEEDTEIELRNVFHRLFEEKGVSASGTRTEDAALMFRALSYCRAPRLMKGVKKTLKGLQQRGAHLYLLSNAQSCFTVPELQRLGLYEGVFDGIFLSSDFGIKKPSPAFFHAALARTGIEPVDALMVGNDPEADIRGAASVGIAGRYIHSRQSPPRGTALPENCREISLVEKLLLE